MPVEILTDEFKPEGAQYVSKMNYRLTDFLGNEMTWDAHRDLTPEGEKISSIWFEGPGQYFTEEKVAASTAKMRAENDACVERILADGFIPYPLFTVTNAGKQVEKVAYLPPTFTPSCTEGFFEEHSMETNIYVPSYERAGEAGTIEMFERFHVKNYYICIDPSQYAKYREVYPMERLVIRDISFRDEDMLIPHSSSLHPISMAGHSPLCNFTLALSRSLGESHFTFADDDFVGLAMKAKKGNLPLQNGEIYDKDDYYRCSNIFEEYGFSFQEFWHTLESFTKKLRNPGFVGLERFGTVFSLPVCFRTGTRVYSFYVTTTRVHDLTFPQDPADPDYQRDSMQIPHEGRQNNDVQTSIDLSKHGYTNILLEMISYNSAQTQAGGGQTEMYQTFGTLDKGKVLVRAQPNYTKIIDRYSRIHHSGDFTNYNKVRVVGAPVSL